MGVADGAEEPPKSPPRPPRTSWPPGAPGKPRKPPRCRWPPLCLLTPAGRAARLQPPPPESYALEETPDPGPRSAQGGGSCSCSFLKALCVLQQFLPYAVVWYGFWIVVNELVAADCTLELRSCGISHWRAEGFGQSQFDKTSVSRDVFSCPHMDDFSEPPNSSVPPLTWVVIGGGTMFVVLVFQLTALVLKIRRAACAFGTLRFVVWTEVAKEGGSLFNRLTKLSAAIILSGAVAQIVYAIRQGGEEEDATEVMTHLVVVIFAAVISIRDAASLVMYDGPVKGSDHAEDYCPEVPLAHDVFTDSQVVCAGIHYILAIHEDVMHDIIDAGGGCEDCVAEALDDLELSHLDGLLIAGLGHCGRGAWTRGEAQRQLWWLRQFFSVPPTREERKRKQMGRGGLLGRLRHFGQGGSDQDPGAALNNPHKPPEHRRSPPPPPPPQSSSRYAAALASAELENAELRDRRAVLETEAEVTRELLQAREMNCGLHEALRGPPRDSAAAARVLRAVADANSAGLWSDEVLFAWLQGASLPREPPPPPPPASVSASSSAETSSAVPSEKSLVMRPQPQPDPEPEPKAREPDPETGYVGDISLCSPPESPTLAPRLPLLVPGGAQPAASGRARPRRTPLPAGPPASFVVRVRQPSSGVRRPSFALPRTAPAAPLSPPHRTPTDLAAACGAAFAPAQWTRKS
eukprot:TRINITY_DN43116_c3_g1_i1.p1 TRINITY_DN43116_c3_g1~~TRINITY_DN43116_c3_g1_i1.p1  ORF type:complete len:690 (+),score=97.63 TRINITY_DN43116_c3_g1_i1:69-2138(+)